MAQVLRGLLVLIAAVLAQTSSADARRQPRRAPEQPPAVVVTINVSSQWMTVRVNGWPSGWWSVSTAAEPDYHTPRGVFRAQRLEEVYFSKKYDNSPMPNSVFFNGGIAIHGTYHINSLGRAVSHGCVRLAPDHAAALFSWVKQYGMNRTLITVTD